MFKKLFGRQDKPSPARAQAPEVMGLRLGGAFELDDLRLRLIEPSLVVEGVARTQFIQAVGVVQLDESTTVVRYYTDDEGFLQILLTGGMTEQHVSDVKMWYFYETKGIGSDAEWNQLLNEGISKPEVSLEQYRYGRVWEGSGENSPPVAMTEKTYAENGSVSETDQFTMLYEREVKEDFFEYLTYAGEEKIISNQADRCFVVSTGFNIQPADIEIIG